MNAHAVACVRSIRATASDFSAERSRLIFCAPVALAKKSKVYYASAMITVTPDGHRQIKPSYTRPPAQGYYDKSGRPFGPGYDFLEYPFPGGPWYVAWSAKLKDGHIYDYYYGDPQPSFADLAPLIAQISQVGDASHSVPTDGQAFNYILRGMATIKVFNH
jgi:hypothetical protein